MSHQASTLEDLVSNFESTSESLERSYRELQGRVQSLIEKLEREYAERVARMGEMAMMLAHEDCNPHESIEVCTSMFDSESLGHNVRSVRLPNTSMFDLSQLGKPIVPAQDQIQRVCLQSVADPKPIPIAIECESTLSDHADSEMLNAMLLNVKRFTQDPHGWNGSPERASRRMRPYPEVEDSGLGIPQERLTRVFDPLFSDNHVGCTLSFSRIKMSEPQGRPDPQAT